jgi:hypothetical protein
MILFVSILLKCILIYFLNIVEIKIFWILT